MTTQNIKEEEVPSFFGLLHLLCDEGRQKFVLIDGRIFAHIEFTEANNSAHKHEMRGRDVTDLLRQYTHSPTSAGVANLIQQIDATKKQVRVWDKSFPFRLFLPWS